MKAFKSQFLTLAVFSILSFLMMSASADQSAGAEKFHADQESGSSMSDGVGDGNGDTMFISGRRGLNTAVVKDILYGQSTTRPFGDKYDDTENCRELTYEDGRIILLCGDDDLGDWKSGDWIMIVVYCIFGTGVSICFFTLYCVPKLTECKFWCYRMGCCGAKNKLIAVEMVE